VLLLLTLCIHYRTTTTTVLRPFFRDHPGEPVPEENFWTLWCNDFMVQSSTEADTPTIQLGATPSGLTSAHLHHTQIQNYLHTFSTDEHTEDNDGVTTTMMLVHGQVTIIFVLSVGLSVSVCLCRVFLSHLLSDFDQTRTRYMSGSSCVP